MLESSFIHLPGIGIDQERALWAQGCMDWTALSDRLEGVLDDSLDKKKVRRSLNRSIRAKGAGEHQYFRKGLGPRNAWRAYPDFKDSCVYLDIETDGRTGGSSITTIGLYDGFDFKALIRHEDLGNFPDIISNYSMIVTFFGSGFDLPVIQKRFPLMRLDQIHIDLCPTLKQLGFSGGLKKIEREFGIVRSPETEGLNGRDAIRLWRRYEVLRDDSALDRLIAYNREDVVNLKTLAELAYARLWAQTKIDSPIQRED